MFRRETTIIRKEIVKSKGLCATKVKSDINKGDREIVVISLKSDYNSEMSIVLVGMTLKQLKNRKAGGSDGANTEILKMGGEPLMNQLVKQFNKCLEQEDTPEDKKTHLGDIRKAILKTCFGREKN